jgi:integrase/recombinase XerD
MDQVDLIEAFRRDLRLQRKTETTVSHYSDWVRRFADFIGSNLLEVTRDDLKNYLDYLRNTQKMREASIKFVFASLSSFYTFLVDESMIAANPVPAFRRKYLRSYKNESTSRSRQLISVDQARMLVNSILDVKDKTLIVLLFKTGARRHELSDLDVEDVDVDELTITLKETPKRSNRILFIDEETANLLKLWVAYRAKRVKNGETALFISQYGVRLSGTAIKVIVEKHAARVGLHNPNSTRLEDQFTPHCCRHWNATHLSRSGMSRDFLKELRGDARSEAVDRYNHIDREALKESYLAHIPQLL